MLNFFNIGGLVQEINSVMLSNMILPPLLVTFLDTDWLLGIWSKRGLNKFIETGEGTPYTQGEANEIVKGQDFLIIDQYSYIFSTIATALFYLPVLPISIFYALASMVIY